jgi:hypothetical protein
MKAKLALFVLPLIAGFFLAAPSVKAIDIPDFPSCTSPTGSVRVSYASGVHGIPGDRGEYIGSDVVYTVSNSQLVQCFCAVTNAGIQTNWWKLSSLGVEQISYLRNLGWIYIPSGAAWGLEDTPYMAQNTTFNCAGSPTPSPAPQPCNGCSGPPTAPVCTAAKPPAPTLISVVRSGTTAQLTWSAVTPVTNYAIFYGLEPGKYIYGVPNTGNVTSYVVGSLQPGVKYYFAVRAVNDCMPSDGSASGQVLGASTILGLADTGNLALIAMLGFSMVTLAILGFFTAKPSRRAHL